MRVPRLYHPAPLRVGAEIRLNRDQAVHVQRVLRLSAGDAVCLFDGEGREHSGELVAVTRGAAVVTVGDAVSARAESGLRTCLLQGVCRGPRMDLVIQKATELGVTRIVPVICERSVVRLDPERSARRLTHWQGVAVAAAEQSGRARLPDIDSPARVGAALAGLGPDGTRVLLSPTGDRGLGSLSLPVVELCLFIGPEGGLTDGERALAVEHGFEECALGPRILRTETATLAALAVLQFLYGDLGGR